MFRYKLRTLLILLAIGPPVLAGAFLMLPYWPIVCCWIAAILLTVRAAIVLERATRRA
jgi:hypothetical protein